MSAAAPFPRPETPFWQELEAGRLTFQRCVACGHAWLPERQCCPSCWAEDIRRETASGKARVVSWVVYHIAYHEAFKDRLPYNVALVELDEGPRLVSNIVNLEGWEATVVDRPCELVIEEDLGRQIPRFRLLATSRATAPRGRQRPVRRNPQREDDPNAETR